MVVTPPIPNDLTHAHPHDRRPEISVVIPCYRSGRWLGELVSRLCDTLERTVSSFEIVLVNDGSPGATWTSIEDLAARVPGVKGIDLVSNVGQFSATLCGIEHSTGKLVATMDDDLQHPPEELPKLIAALSDNPSLDCVIARYQHKRHGWLRNLCSRLMHRVNEFIHNKPRELQFTSFRVMRSDIAKTISKSNTSASMLGPLLLATTRSMANVEVNHAERPNGQSGYSLPKLLKLGITNATHGRLNLSPRVVNHTHPKAQVRTCVFSNPNPLGQESFSFMSTPLESDCDAPETMACSKGHGALPNLPFVQR